MEELEIIVSGEFGGFRSRESQLVNALARGLGENATRAEVLEFDQLRRNMVNAAHYGYPAGTTSAQIGYDLAERGIPNSG